MKIAMPVVDGQVCMHFGHCQGFALVDVDLEKKEILGKEVLPSPPHQPGLLPKWLAEQGANLVISGGMGMRAQQIFAQYNIEVVVGAPTGAPEEVARAYIEGTLDAGENICDH